MTQGHLVDTVAMPVGITELVTRTGVLTIKHGPGLVAIQFDEATLGIFTPGDVIPCPTCEAPLDDAHARHSGGAR